MTSFRYFGMTVTNGNHIHEKATNKLISFEITSAPDRALQRNDD